MLQIERVQHFVFVTMSECAQIAPSRPPSLLSRLTTPDSPQPSKHTTSVL